MINNSESFIPPICISTNYKFVAPAAAHQAAAPNKAAGGKRKMNNDPNRPKRPTSAYFYFVQIEREEAAKRGEKITRVRIFESFYRFWRIRFVEYSSWHIRFTSVPQTKALQTCPHFNPFFYRFYRIRFVEYSSWHIKFTSVPQTKASCRLAPTLTLLLPAYHCRQWESLCLYTSPIEKGLIIIFIIYYIDLLYYILY